MKILNNVAIVFVDGRTIPNNSFQTKIRIEGKTFKCSICGKKKDYESEYVATYKTKTRSGHVCLSCLPLIRRGIFNDTR